MAMQQDQTWNQAREVYFHSAKNPERQYKWCGIKGEIIDIRVYPCPRPELLLVSFGETYHNTTGWDIHVLLMRTNDIPTYPGNVCRAARAAFALVLLSVAHYTLAA